MTPSLRVRLGALLSIAVLVLGVAVATSAAHAVDDPVVPGVTTVEENEVPTITPAPSVARSGTQIRVSGTNWPGGIPIQVSLCGNAALNGTADCDGRGAGSTTTRPDGSFTLYMTANTPPVPCPCVIYVNSFETELVGRQPFSLVGAAEAPTQIATSTRAAEAAISLDGMNLGAWFGGAAKRTVTFRLTNKGSGPITDPVVTITAGSTSDPTSVVAQPKLGTIQPGETGSFEVPISFSGPTFGTYHVKATVTGAGDQVEASASTSSYPWALVVLIWLALQPLLLGLYKRRPVVEGDPDDPLGGPFGVTPGPVAPASAAVAASVAHEDRSYAPWPTPVAATAVLPVQDKQLVPNYQPVFGVEDLRTYLDPAAKPSPTTVVPRIVLGGIPPSVNGHQPH